MADPFPAWCGTGEVAGKSRWSGDPSGQADFFAVLAGVFLVSDVPDEPFDFLESDFESELESDFVSVFVSEPESDFESEPDLLSDDALERAREESRLSVL
jgi:hypothetical protein